MTADQDLFSRIYSKTSYTKPEFLGPDHYEYLGPDGSLLFGESLVVWDN
jgi:hypothetical protein